MNKNFITLLQQDASLNKILNQIRQKRSVNISGMEDDFKSVFLSFLKSELTESIIYIAPTDFLAKKFIALLPAAQNAMLYPSLGLYTSISTAHDKAIDYQRINTLCALGNSKRILIVTSAEALSNPIHSDLYQFILTLKVSETLDIASLVKKLVGLGYERSELTESPGQFSVRGSIVDIFAINHDNPVRIDFFDDEIESIKTFDAATQSSHASIKVFSIYPSRENLFSEDEESHRMKKAGAEIQKRISALEKMSNKDENTQEIIDNLNRLKDELSTRLIYTSSAKEEKTNLLSYTQNFVLVLDSFNEIEQSYLDHLKTYMLLYTELLEKGKAFSDEISALMSFEELLETFRGNQTVALGNLATSSVFTHAAPIDLHVRGLAGDLKNFNGLKEAFLSYAKQQYTFIVCFSTNAEKTAVTELFSLIESLPAACVQFIKTPLMNSFDLYESKLLFIAASTLLKSHKKVVKERRSASQASFFSDFVAGDYVVHDIFGIGRYKGNEQILTDGVRKDFAVIEYAQSSVIYVPLDQMYKVQQYIGSSDTPPRLSRLGSSDWKESKAKTKRAVQEMAKELLELYSKREQTQGFAFSQDSIWQAEFEAAFTYEETNEQLKCIDEIKKDMQSARPMDRLLCGDVGYGKTEVAQRAAFKAVDNSKQVAVLVPTTVLALQHYKNFCERFAAFPITIEMMSRFKTKAQQKEIMQRLKAGKIDILIGTHRILSDDVTFHDLGLLIVDEEQRFGVAHKEKIKQYKANVDVLTLTATPIPRTLHMSMIGIRDISILNEPPQNRFPVLTFVMEYDDLVVKNAIHKELAQSGQVYYIYNKVKGIEYKAQMLQNLIPEAKIAYAHGQMAESRLERLMAEFIEGKYDIFLSTTIVENGLDIPSANTMIIEDAHKMGLAQLYQLKGRVGRSDRQAYAYITYPQNKILPVDAQKRLKAIRDYTSFGSGHKIALRDLQIRGAGNILGLSQSGHFGDVGYEMYSRILKEVLNEAKGITQQEPLYAEIDLHVNAYVPEHYIASSAQRMELYRDIALLETPQQISSLRENIADRYGKLPYATENLLQIGYLRNLAQTLGIEKIKQEKNMIKMIPSAVFDTSILQELYKTCSFKVITTKKQVNELHFNNTSYLSSIEYVKKILDTISSLKIHN